MRFRRLTLERFGNFEDCPLAFRDGLPDLHIIYGPNEAGKSTTLAAVSDLLFGFGARTPHNYRFDNALLRIGAELEEDGRRIVFRRRRSKPTVVDAADQPIDEAPLLAMLRGQTQDSFRLAFSLDQGRLREGGRAMVKAKDDVGQALFAAASGMTAVAAELDRLNAEADAIWGRRAANKRSYTVAERAFGDAQKLVRELALRPRAWTEAKTAESHAEDELRAFEAQRQTLLAEQRYVERLRRLAPPLRRRTELLQALDAQAGAVAMSPQRETLATAALAAVDTAERERRAAADLFDEAADRAGKLQRDTRLLGIADRIDALIERRGEIAKSTHDRARLIIERHAKQSRIAEHYRELGGETAIPSRLTVMRMRDIARRHAEAKSGAHTIDASLADLAAREKPLRDRLADASLSETLSTLVAAVDAARRLGNDVDTRCAAASRASTHADAQAVIAFARLLPWSGSAEELLALATISEDEIEAAQVEHSGLRSRIGHEAATADRINEDTETLALEADALGRQGGAISADTVTQARTRRDDRWMLLIDHLRGTAMLADPLDAVDTFGRAMADADAVADRRFAVAEASGRLVELDARRSGLRLQVEQARRRRADAEGVLAAMDMHWRERLATALLPVLDPIPLRAWLGDRRAALDAVAAALAARQFADAEDHQRSATHRALVSAMPGEATTESVLLAPVLERAEAVRRDGEARDAAFREDRAELRQIVRSLDEQRRRRAQAAAETYRIDADWQEALGEAGNDLGIATADARLAILEELRADLDAMSQLDSRLNGIDTDVQRFEADLTALATEVDELAATGREATLTALRARLDAAREIERQLAELTAQRSLRQREIDIARATRDAAMQSLAPVFAEAKLVPGDDLAGAVEASQALRRLCHELAEVERQITAGGDGLALVALVAEWQAADPDWLAQRGAALMDELADLNARISAAATATGEASRSFASIEGRPGAAAHAAADAEQAHAEMVVQAEAYLLKRAEAVMLRWAIERYRERRQDPLLVRASELFATLTLGRYRELRVDVDDATPRLGGLCDDGRTIVDVEAMSEGTTDQLFLALRLAAVEQSVAAGVRLPFLADDLFVNFDDSRAEAGFRVLADLARSTQVLFFTHHPHLVAIAAKVVGADRHSECTFN